jgi:hypothetical protein
MWCKVADDLLHYTFIRKEGGVCREQGAHLAFHVSSMQVSYVLLAQPDWLYGSGARR